MERKLNKASKTFTNRARRESEDESVVLFVLSNLSAKQIRINKAAGRLQHSTPFSGWRA